jgi:hypothetical protein
VYQSIESDVGYEVDREVTARFRGHGLALAALARPERAILREYLPELRMMAATMVAKEPDSDRPPRTPGGDRSQSISSPRSLALVLRLLSVPPTCPHTPETGRR